MRFNHICYADAHYTDKPTSQHMPSYLLGTCLRIFSAHAFVSFGTAALWHSGQRTLHVSRNNHVLLSLAVPLTLCLSVSPSTVLS